MKNWKSTISGAFAALGVFLFGAPIAMSAAGSDIIPQSWVKWCVLAGFLMQGFGIFFGHFFSADAATVKELKAQVNENTDALRTGDTSLLRKPDPPAP